VSPVVNGCLASGAVFVLAFAAVGIRRASFYRRTRRRLGSSRFTGAAVVGSLDMPPWVSQQFGVIGVVVVGLIGLALDGVVLAVLFAILTGVLFVSLRAHRRTLRLRAYNRNLVRVLDIVALSLRSGAGLVVGLREAAQAHAGAVEQDLRAVVRHLDLGQPFERAMAVWVDRTGLRSVRLTVACLTLAHRTGGSNAESISAVRATVQHVMSAEAAVQTHAAQARASAAALAIMPFLLSGPMLVASEASRRFMLHTPIGTSFLFAGLVLDVLGVWWMSRMIQEAQS
jgi:tight adherence protein B